MPNKSLLGSSFDEYVSNQLKIRARIYSSDNTVDVPKGYIQKSHLPYTIANTAFLRLSSGVNVESEDKALFFGKKEYQGSGLARNFILQGGTTAESGSMKGGLNAYKVGGIQDFGLRPMPGITSAKITAKGRWGSLREANIEIKCYNRDQLSIVETLYLRPGYTILLEWGNTLFYDNNFRLINNISFIDFFNEGKTLDNIQEEILAKREQYSGNYNAFIGPVTNFNIKQSPDGSYNCSVKAITWGGIIESLKINTTGNPNLSLNSNNNIESNPDNKFSLKNEKLESSRLLQILDNIYRTCNNLGDEFGNITNIYEEYYDKNPTGYSINSNPTEVDPEILTRFGVLSFGNTTVNKTTSEIIPFQSNLNVYIPLGGLLSILCANCLIYNANNTPLIKINFNHNENFCYSPSNHISMDPNVCLIKYGGAEFKPFGLNKELTRDVDNPLLTFKHPTSQTTGLTMNIMLNLQYLINKLSVMENTSENKEVNLYDFLDSILTDINLALGGVNEFNIGYDQDTNTVVIYDNQILDISEKSLTIINTTGVKSYVRDININSKLSNQLSSMIAIGAQASNNVATGIDSSVFLRYNKDLKDRFFPIKKDINNINFISLDEYIESLNNDERAKAIKNHLFNIYANRTIIIDNNELCKNYYKEIIKTIKVKSDSSTGIIPFTFSIKMNGISGVQYGQLFSIEPERLPKNYLDSRNKNQPLVAFLVTQIEESIVNNDWTTTIEGQTSPIRNLKVKN